MNRLLRRTTAAALSALLLASCARDVTPPAPLAPPVHVVAAQPAGAYVSAVDEGSGVPSFLWAMAGAKAPSGASVEAAARSSRP